MWVHVAAILGLGALCGGWVLVQRWTERCLPGRGHPRGGCGGCAKDCDTRI